MKKFTRQKRSIKNTLTLMLVPHFSGKAILSVKIRRWFLYFSVSLLIIMVVVFGASLFYSSSLTRKLLNYSSLVTQNKIQKYQLGNMRKKMAVLDAQVGELLERDQQLRGLLGLGSFNMDKATAQLQKKKISYTPEKSLETVQSSMEQIHLDLVVREASYQSLKETIKQYQTRFAHTPSIWPVYGRMGSRYGWRRHPIFRVWQMHRGVDFPTWRGAPVKTTADGVVEKVGWMGGFGKTVVINHQYGIKTLYAHNSRYLVRPGMRVKKGQVIAEAGSTGLSTGTHLHYEVIKGSRAVYPNTYLNLNLFTAAKKGYW